MRIGSLFSGIGGLELGLEMSGLGKTVWQVESSQFCRRVLSTHWPEAIRHEDVRTVGAGTLEPVDLICGGFPCQDISSAGKGAGLAGKRSGLWGEFARIVTEMRPEWVVVENVASGARRWVDSVVRRLQILGYETLPVPLSAQDVGAPHLRRRVFIIANSEFLREQQGRSRGTNRENTILAESDGQKRALGHPYDEIEQSQPIDGKMARMQGVANHSSAWSVAPEFRGVDDGVPNRMDRNRALGNAVVPQCAEVIGWMIKVMEEADDHIDKEKR